MNKTVLSLMAHPDDCEFGCAGTLSLLKDKGWDIHIATMTPGDCGSVELSREKISEIRRGESANAAGILDGEYHCLECEDVFIMYDKPTLLKTIEVIRQVKPDIVFAPSPQDYFVDHENTSRLVWTACFSTGMPNVQIEGTKPVESVPYLYYADPMEGKDKFGKRIVPSVYVDISEEIGTKEKMLCCHQSQRQWLMKHHGMDKYTEMMKTFSQRRGKEINTGYAEGFRQHLGHSFPQDNILKTEFGNLVKDN
jgi:LmbE family N-acetylglucosaminyl deacetylase